MWENNTLIDNSPDHTLADCLRVLIKKENVRELCIATGYWDIPGTALLLPELTEFIDNGGKLRMIIGEEPTARHSQLTPERSAELRQKKFPDHFIKLDVDDLKDEFKPAIRFLFQYCTDDDDSRIQIRVFGQDKNPKQFMHAKCYIFCGPNAVGIIGSANFTRKGLEENSELSYLETDPARVSAVPNAYSTSRGHIDWFEEKWAESIPWNKTFINEILKPSPIGQRVRHETFKVTPYAVYMKYLQNLFGAASGDGNNFFPDYPGFTRLQYQEDAVNRGYSIMLAHHGFILADVVGLGKTTVALMLANKFLNTPDPDGREKKILIVTPPAVKKSWESEIANFDINSDGRLKNSITIITTGKVVGLEEVEDADDSDDDDGDLVLDNKQYGLILIDESHKFRNSDTEMYRVMDDFIGGIYPQPYVVLLSATPQNNAPKDLKNQIYLFQRTPKNTTLEGIDGHKLDSFFDKKQKDFATAKKQGDYDAIKELSQEIRSKVLDQLVVRRTRTDIRKFYQADAANLHFPEISGPHPLEYKLDAKLSQLFFDTMNMIAPTDPETGEFELNDSGLRFERYRAIEYLKAKEDRARYQVRNLTPESTSKRLAKIMQILLVKRLESSFAAFKASLGNLRRYTQNMVDMLNDNCVFICPDIDVNAELDTVKKERSKEECYAALRTLLQHKSGNNLEYRADAFKPEYLTRLKADMAKIELLCERWDQVSEDPKLQVFLKAFDEELFDPQRNNPHGYDRPRLVIFTEAIDTLEQLVKSIGAQGRHRILAVSAENRAAMTKAIKANFDANAKPEERRDDYDVLITTEVLAEGINLHRANVILNYDTPWNSTRLMQRIGRVNRIGSKEDYVHVYNFMPTPESDRQIELVKKAHSKLQAFHAMFGEDSQIFTTREEVASYGTDPAALRKLIEGEASPLEPYAAELREFKRTEPEYFDWIAGQPDEIGACKAGAGEQRFACVVKRPSCRAGLNVLIKGEQAADISTLEMIKFLQCAPGTVSLPTDDDTMARFPAVAMKYYTDFASEMILASDGNKKRTAALAAIYKIREKFKLPADTRALLATAEPLVRHNDRPLMRRIMKLEAELDKSLPGMEIAVINDALGALAHRTHNAEEPTVSLYMLNRGDQK